MLNKEILTAHCPNSGSMMGLLNEGENAWISESKNTERKLKYTLEILEQNKQKVGVNTHLTNRIVEEALINKKIKELENFDQVQREVKFNSNTRFDFLVSNKNFSHMKSSIQYIRYRGSTFGGTWKAEQ